MTEADALLQLRHKLHLMDRNFLDRLEIVVSLPAEDRLMHGCRDLEAWIKSNLKQFNRDREALITEWEKNRP